MLESQIDNRESKKEKEKNRQMKNKRIMEPLSIGNRIQRKKTDDCYSDYTHSNEES